MQVIDKKEDRASPIERDGRAAGIPTNRVAARSCQLRLFIMAAGLYALKKRNLARLAINFENELLALQISYERSSPVEDRDVGLHQRGIDPHHVVALTWCTLLLLSECPRGKRREDRQKKKRADWKAANSHESSGFGLGCGWPEKSLVMISCRSRKLVPKLRLRYKRR